MSTVWEPIDTAPKDGTPFLGLSDHIISPTGYLAIWMAEKSEGDPYFRSVVDHEPLYDLTHWCPLPVGTIQGRVGGYDPI